jgi:hypothetical protein
MVFTNVTLLHCAQNLRQYQFARELVFGLRAFPHANEKFSGLTPHVAEHPERVTEIRVTALIERTAQSNPRLHGGQHTVPGYFRNGITPQGGHAARLSKLYS